MLGPGALKRIADWIGILTPFVSNRLPSSVGPFCFFLFRSHMCVNLHQVTYINSIIMPDGDASSDDDDEDENED